MPTLLRSFTLIAALVTGPVALSASLALSTSLAEEEIAYAPAAKTKVTRHFDAEWSLVREQATLAILDTVRERGVGIGEVYRVSLEVEDELGAVAEGRPREFQRLYRKAGITRELEIPEDCVITDLEAKREQTSPLEGRRVRFAWNEGKGEYDRESGGDEEEGGIDEALLDELQEDLDLRFLLPPGEPAEGNLWEIEPALFAAILTPGGFLVPPEMTGERKEFSARERDYLLPEGLPWEYFVKPAGKITGEFLGVREKEGVRLAAIEIRGNLEDEEAELIEVFDERIGREHQQADTDFEMEGKGLLLWDLERNLPASFQFTGKLRLSLNVEWLVTQRGRLIPVGYIQERTGTFRLSMRCE
jgi:hypothetical protein